MRERDRRFVRRFAVVSMAGLIWIVIAIFAYYPRAILAAFLIFMVASGCILNDHLYQMSATCADCGQPVTDTGCAAPCSTQPMATAPMTWPVSRSE